MMIWTWHPRQLSQKCWALTPSTNPRKNSTQEHDKTHAPALVMKMYIIGGKWNRRTVMTTIKKREGCFELWGGSGEERGLSEREREKQRNLITVVVNRFLAPVALYWWVWEPGSSTKKALARHATHEPCVIYACHQTRASSPSHTHTQTHSRAHTPHTLTPTLPPHTHTYPPHTWYVPPTLQLQ